MVPENDLVFHDVYEMDIETNYINITRNAFDIPHFTTVHGWGTVEIVDFGYEAGHKLYPHCAYIDLLLSNPKDVKNLPEGKKSRVLTRSFDPFNNRLDVYVDDVHLVTNFNKLTETDDNETTLQAEFWLPEGMPASVGDLFMTDAAMQTRQDIPLWKKMDPKNFIPVTELDEFYLEWIGRFE
jgi:hypothetical protein